MPRSTNTTCIATKVKMLKCTHRELRMSIYFTANILHAPVRSHQQHWIRKKCSRLVEIINLKFHVRCKTATNRSRAFLRPHCESFMLDFRTDNWRIAVNLMYKYNARSVLVLRQFILTFVACTACFEIMRVRGEFPKESTNQLNHLHIRPNLPGEQARWRDEPNSRNCKTFITLFLLPTRTRSTASRKLTGSSPFILLARP